MATTGITNGTLIAIYKDISGSLTKIANATSNDFTNPVTYTVTAEDGGTQDYTVTITNAFVPVVTVTLGPTVVKSVYVVEFVF